MQVDYNDDSYRAYIHCDAEINDAIYVKGRMEIANGTIIEGSTLGAIKSKGNSQYIRYRLADDSASYSDYFEINEYSGVITLEANAEDYISDEESYFCSLEIEAYDSRLWGQDNFCVDTAFVEVSFSHWFVVRTSNSEIAYTTANDGCTIEMLAEQIGLTAEEYQSWLTISGGENATVELFDGSVVLARTVSKSAILAENSLFRVPNVMYVAWMGEASYAGYEYMRVQESVNQLRSMGFYVSEFNNDSLIYEFVDARTDFCTTIQNLAVNKRLHGLCMYGHGNYRCVGPEGFNKYLQYLPFYGSVWSVEYCPEGTVVSNSTYLGDDPSAWSIATALKYRLGALLVFACESDIGYTEEGDPVPSTSHNLITVSNKSIFRGFDGTYNPADDDHDSVGKYWGFQFIRKVQVHNGSSPTPMYRYFYKIGGKQGTAEVEIMLDYPLITEW